MQCTLTLAIDILRALPLTRRPGQMKGKGKVIYKGARQIYISIYIYPLSAPFEMNPSDGITVLNV